MAHDVRAQLDRIEGLLRYTARKVYAMSIATDRLKAAVEANTTIDSSVRALVAGLIEQVREAAAGDAAMLEVADRLERENAEAAAWVLANTPAAPPV